MITQLFRRKKELTFERSYPAPITAVWDAWTRPELLRQWWGPEDTTVTDAEVELHVGGRLYLVMEAGEGMGKYQGTRWPMAGTFTHIEQHRHLAYEARSWTEGEEETTTIEHVNDVRFAEDGNETTVNLRITIVEIGSGAKMAAFGMRWGYKAQLDKLGAHLAATGPDVA
ncbi:SRPBCC domain-containing protein [Egicoccus sp. AB-alg6-2]|uniref:SRPBCC family protein n=1 Tax=Egicoccus sp. AB-alg6-2 TaxID=3242692 RepID=UPI00359E17D0